MKSTHPTHWMQTVFLVTGFERLQFVSDVAEAALPNENYRLDKLRFESDGVRVSGCLTIRTPDTQHLSRITQRLLAVRGIVSVQEKR